MKKSPSVSSKKVKRYKTQCYLCEKPLTRTHYDIVLPAFACFLCDVHIQAVRKWLGVLR